MNNEKLHTLAISDAGFVFDPATGETFTLNETGKEIVALLKQGYDRQGIREHFLLHYDCHRDQLDRDLDFFFTRMSEYGIIGELGDA